MAAKKSAPVKKVTVKTKTRAGNSARVKGPGLNASFFERAEFFLAGQMKRIFWVSFALTAVVSLLLFDIRFSLSGDDSSYVVRAFDFIHHFIFPGFQGPLYPLIISPFVAIFGLSPVPLKGLSLLFILGFTWFFYTSLLNRVPALLLAAMLVLLPVNSFILYYGSQTYSEAFFMFLQAITLTLFFTWFIDRQEIKAPGLMVKQHLIFALCLLALGLTRSIGFSAVIAVLVYLLVKKEWKNLLFAAASFAAVLVVYQGLRLMLFAHQPVHFSADLQGLIAKDYYNPALGHETVLGIIKRFLSNANYYLSDSLYTILGFRAAGGSADTSILLTLATCLLILAATIVTFRRNKYLLFAGIYVIVTFAIIFLILQPIWMQSRLIIPYVPLILLLIIGLFYQLFSLKKLAKFQIALPVLAIILFVASVITAMGHISEARKIDSKYYGLTPDWQNYCRMSEWCAANLDANATIACRKPSIAFISGNGRNFYGITRLPFTQGDSLVRRWQRNNLHYWLIRASSLNNKPVSQRLSIAFGQGMAGIGMNMKNKFYEARFYVLNFSEYNREDNLQELKTLGIGFADRADSLAAWLKEPGTEISMIYPDSVLKILADAHVTHVMTDNIRAFPDLKNQQTVTLVSRFMNFIEAKYPGIRTRIMQTGNDDDEPAALYKINYEQAGMPQPK